MGLAREPDSTCTSDGRRTYGEALRRPEIVVFGLGFSLLGDTVIVNLV